GSARRSRRGAGAPRPARRSSARRTCGQRRPRPSPPPRARTSCTIVRRAEHGGRSVADDAEVITDGRRARGDRTRRQVVTRAAALASVSGLSAVSLDAVARGLGVSESGVAAAFGSKEELELATVAAAREIFIEEV